MSWLTRVRNAIPFLPKRETPDNLWHKCPQCDAMVFTKEYEDNLYVCPRCDHHGRIGPKLRFALLLDPGYKPGGTWPDAPVLGLGVALRLVRNLAIASGGMLEIDTARFHLSLPLRGRGGHVEQDAI